jgi:hypothetical protein
LPSKEHQIAELQIDALERQHCEALLNQKTDTDLQVNLDEEAPDIYMDYSSNDGPAHTVRVPKKVVEYFKIKHLFNQKIDSWLQSVNIDPKNTRFSNVQKRLLPSIILRFRGKSDQEIDAVLQHVSQLRVQGKPGGTALERTLLTFLAQTSRRIKNSSRLPHYRLHQLMAIGELAKDHTRETLSTEMSYYAYQLLQQERELCQEHGMIARCVAPQEFQMLRDQTQATVMSEALDLLRQESERVTSGAVVLDAVAAKIQSTITAPVTTYGAVSQVAKPHAIGQEPAAITSTIAPTSAQDRLDVHAISNLYADQPNLSGTPSAQTSSLASDAPISKNTDAISPLKTQPRPFMHHGG